MIARDKVLHFLVGFAVALICAAAWWFLAQVGLMTATDAGAAGLVGACVAGATKEGADHMDNKIQPGMHGVEWRDALATALGGVPVLIAQLVLR